MPKFEAILLILLGFCSAAQAACGPTENCVEVVSAQVEYSCAPWDGQALRLTMKYDGKFFRASAWSNGIKRVLEGKPVRLDNSSHSEDMGGAALCETEQSGPCEFYEAGEVELRLPKETIGATSPVRGNVVIKGQVVPVEATWVETHPFCG